MCARARAFQHPIPEVLVVSHIDSALPTPLNHQTGTPCPFPLCRTHHPISPAYWGPLSSPEQPAAVQTGSLVAGAGVGVS